MRRGFPVEGIYIGKSEHLLRAENEADASRIEENKCFDWTKPDKRKTRVGEIGKEESDMRRSKKRRDRKRRLPL